MWLLRQVRAFTGWALSISRKMVRIAPGYLIVVLLATLVSHLSRLAAFFLPLKIVILIGSPGVPHYFPRAFLDMEREALVIGLGVAAASFYVLYLLAEKVADICAERSADRVIEEADKLYLFANQDDIVRNACRKFAESIAALIFAGLALVLIGFLHPSVAVLIVSWVVAMFLIAMVGGMLSAGFRARLEDDASDLVSVASALGFFAATALIVAEFIAGASFNILYAIVSLLLARQAMQQLGKVVRNALTLSSLKPFINALFFRGHVRPGREVARSNDVWDLIAPGQPERWLPAALLEAVDVQVESAAMTRWHSTGLLDVVALDVKASGAEEADYLVKLFGFGKEMAAAHEMALFAAIRPERLLAPDFLGMTRVDGATCLVFRNIAGYAVQPSDVLNSQISVHGKCWTCEPTRELAQRFKRSHRLLDQRLAIAPVDRLAFAAYEPAERELVNDLQRVLEPLMALLSRLPLAIYNPDLFADALFEREDGSKVAIHWGRWSLEPIGAGWPDRKAKLPAMEQWLDTAREMRTDLRSVTVEQVRLVALMFAFEKLLAGQKYRAAIVMVPEILSAADEAGLGEVPQIVDAATTAAQ